jgi:hypothetical protein
MCQKCEWEKYKDVCGVMMEDEEYDFALETIEGIFDWVEKNEHITEKQKIAIKNIQESKFEE